MNLAKRLTKARWAGSAGLTHSRTETLALALQGVSMRDYRHNRTRRKYLSATRSISNVQTGRIPITRFSLDEFAAPTRAHHRAPEVAVLAHDINHASAELPWEIVNHNRAVQSPIPLTVSRSPGCHFVIGYRVGTSGNRRSAGRDVEGGGGWRRGCTELHRCR